MSRIGLPIRLLAMIAASSVYASVPAAEWEPVTDTETAIYLLDRSSLSVTDSGIRAWVLVTGPYGRGLPDYGSRMQLMIFDCGGVAVALKEYALYSLPAGQGTVLRTETFGDEQLEFTQPGPGSVGEQLLGKVCDR
jgi:hypothetical protein